MKFNPIISTHNWWKPIPFDIMPVSWDCLSVLSIEHFFALVAYACTTFLATRESYAKKHNALTAMPHNTKLVVTVVMPGCQNVCDQMIHLNILRFQMTI